MGFRNLKEKLEKLFVGEKNSVKENLWREFMWREMALVLYQKITKNYFQTINASTTSDEGEIKLADMVVSINHTSDLLQMEEDSQRKGRNIIAFMGKKREIK